MLIETPYTNGDVVSIKLSSGEEMIARLDSENDTNVIVSKPYILIAAQNGMALAPYMFTVTPDTKIKLKINNILLGHHLDDLFENFFIRILRGSGLNGLISLDKETQRDAINLIRPLINFNKKDLIYLSNFIFGSYVVDPSNEDDKFKRVKVRNFLKQLGLEGLDRNKFYLTIKNLKLANENIKFYVKKIKSLESTQKHFNEIINT
mgnify:CR=1 FL=1